MTRLTRSVPIAVALILAAATGVRSQAPATASPPSQTAPSPSKSTIIQKVIVKVNGEIFTQAELERLQIEALRDKDNLQRNPRDLNDAALASVLGDITPRLLMDAIDELLIVQRGRELGAKFTDEHLTRAVENIKKEYNLDDKGLEAAMAQQGLTREELRQQIERSFYRQQVQQNELQVNLTDEEGRQYYKNHPEEFRKPATVTVREITVNADGSDAAQQAAQAKLTQIRDRVGKGEDFAKLAQELSDSPGGKDGGLIAGVELGVIDPSFRAEIEKLQIGQTTPPIKTSSGFIVFKLESRTEAQPLPFEEVRNQILQKIFGERMAVEEAKHIEKLRAQALIEWKDEGYRQMYERAVAARKAGKAGEPALGTRHSALD